jgi:hypothetical protein
MSLPAFAYEGVGYRGLKLDGNDELKRKYLDYKNEFVVGQLMTFPAFMSVSTDDSVADDFGDFVFFVFVKVRGARVARLSQLPKEAEILVPPPSVFRIKAVAKVGTTKSFVGGHEVKSGGRLTVTLEQESCPLTYLSQKASVAPLASGIPVASTACSPFVSHPPAVASEDPKVLALSKALEALDVASAVLCLKFAKALDEQGILTMERLKKLPEPDAREALEAAGMKKLQVRTVMEAIASPSSVAPSSPPPAPPASAPEAIKNTAKLPAEALQGHVASPPVIAASPPVIAASPPMHGQHLPPGWRADYSFQYQRYIYISPAGTSQWGPPPSPPSAATTAATFPTATKSPISGPVIPQPPVETKTSLLPKGWAESTDPITGRLMYTNVVSGTSQWERPHEQPALTFAAPAAPPLPPPSPPMHVASPPMHGQHLPPGWRADYSFQYQRYIYISPAGTSQWEPPPSPPSAATTAATFPTATKSPISGPVIPQPPVETKISLLPKGWVEQTDPFSGNQRYTNFDTGTIQWERPL